MSSLKQRKLALRAFESMQLCKSKSPPASVCTLYESVGGLLGCLSDDCVAVVMRFLLSLVPKSSHKNMVNGARSVFALCLTCKRLASLLDTVCIDVKLEALARLATNVVPKHAPLCERDLNFCSQIQREIASRRHILMLKAAQQALACHCAGACCAKYHRAFNHDLKRGRDYSKLPRSSRVVSAASSCAIFCTTPDGTHSYQWTKRRVSKRSLHGEHRGRTHRSLITRTLQTPDRETGTPSVSNVGSIEIETDSMSDPVAIEVSHSGNTVAFIRTMWSELDSEMPFSSAFVCCGLKNVVKVPQPEKCGLDNCQLMSAQEAWFARGPADEETLVVAWSTSYYHPSGHKIGSIAQDQQGDAYIFTKYAVETDGENTDCSVIESTFPEHGSLMACSRSEDGVKVAALLKTNGRIGSHRSVKLYDINGPGDCHEVASNSTAGLTGPLVACLSPAGNSVASLHTSLGRITLSLSLPNDAGHYATALSVNLTEFFTSVARDPEPIVSDLLKARLKLSFSPCGRFVAVLDQSPLFGQLPQSVSLVVVDTDTRRDTLRTVKCLPLVNSTLQAARALSWTQSGFYLSAPGTDEFGSVSQRGGLLFLGVQ